MEANDIRRAELVGGGRRETYLGARPKGKLMFAGAALLLWGCAPGSAGSEPGDPKVPTALVRDVDNGAAGAECNDPLETTPDDPPPALSSGAASPCSAQDPGVDWSSVPVLSASSRRDLRMRLRNGAASLDVCIEGSRLDYNYELFIDADGNATTGVPEDPWRSMGAEYKVVNNVLHGPSNGHAWPDVNPQAPQVATRSTNAIVIHVRKDLLPGLVPHFALGFRELKGWSKFCTWLPGAANHPVRLQLPSVPAERRAQRGLIVPLYALVPGVDGTPLNRDLTQQQCQAVLAGDYSSLKPVDARPGDVAPTAEPVPPGAQEPVPPGALEPVPPGAQEPVPPGAQEPVPPGAQEPVDTGGGVPGDTDTEPGDDEDDDDDDEDDDEEDDSVDTFAYDDPSADAMKCVGDPGMWRSLAEAAETFGAKQPGRDYWVAVNGPKSGPFMRQGDFKKAAACWQPIRQKGGKVFGYVHTRVDPDVPGLRPLCEVIADVVRWKQGLTWLDGIWIDEFYPQDEGKATTPSTVQVDPQRGYYAQLTRAIHGLDPNLVLIGNVGAALESNLRRYGELVDVACTLENSEAEAAKDKWGGISVAPIVPTYAQLGLIHGFSCAAASCPAVESTVQRAFDHGYSHIFITNAAYEKTKKDGTAVAPAEGPPKPKLWQELPPFFNQLVGEVARQVSARAGDAY